MLKSVDCRWNRQSILCANSKVKRTLFGIGRRFCIQHNSPNTICPHISSWPKVALAVGMSTVISKPTLKSVKGLELYCHACKGLIEDPGALLFSPPKGITVRKYHLCSKCYNIIISSIETGSLFFGNNRED